MESTQLEVAIGTSVEAQMRKKSRAIAVLSSIETGDSTAMSFINTEKFKQHNLTAEDGVEGFAKMMTSLSDFPEVAMVNTVRVIEDGEFVVAHTEYNLFGEKIGFDIFRFEDDLIVEHWDNLQPKVAQKNPSGHTMIDGVREIKLGEPTEKNRALIKDFAEDILIGGNFQNIDIYFDGDNYIQHNPTIGDGLTAFNAALKEMAAEGVAMQFNKIHHIFCESDFVLLVTEGVFGKDGGVPTSFYDLFRVENGKIAEHWDVIEAITPPDERRNNNGKF